MMVRDEVAALGGLVGGWMGMGGGKVVRIAPKFVG